MTDILNRLFESGDVKEFVKQFKEVETHFGEPMAFLEALGEWLPLRVYERFYGEDAPHSFFGVSCAASVAPWASEERKWWPALQQAWHVARQPRRSPWPVQGDPETSGSTDQRWGDFRKACADGDFDACYRLARGFLARTEEAALFERRILGEALRDASGDGLKLILLAQSFEFARVLEGKHADRILFPALHFFVLGPRDESLAEIAGKPAGSALANREGSLGEDHLNQFERATLFSDSDQSALDALDRAAAAGAGIEGAWEALQITALQALANSKPGSQQSAARAAGFVALARRASTGWESADRLAALRSAAVRVRRASTATREGGQNRDLGEVARVLLPTDTVNTLKSVVSHSDPIASATASIALLAMEEPKQRELCETLVSLAAKNDGHMGRGYDLLTVATAAEGHWNFSSPAKDRLLACCAFYLGRLRKSYELFGAYGVK